MGASHPLKHSWVVGTIETMSLILNKWWFYVSKIQGLLGLLAGNSHCIKLHPTHVEGVKGTLRMIKWQWQQKGNWKFGSFYTWGNWGSDRSTPPPVSRTSLKPELTGGSRPPPSVPGSFTMWTDKRQKGKKGNSNLYVDRITFRKGKQADFKPILKPALNCQ